MCGVAGSWRPDVQTDGEPDPWVEEALDRIAYRGPDARDTIQWTAATHGHVRLAILDLDHRSDQPYLYGGVILSYVGELWNFEELRSWLHNQHGYQFRTEGDTEVVAAMMNHALKSGTGPGAALRMMDGQFALAVTESLTGRTWVARDRMGEVPLYLHEEGGNLFDASRIRWASERRCFGEQASEAVPVPAGACWQLGDAPDYFYDLRLVAGQRGVVRDVERVRELVSIAVKKRLRSDVPVAFLCSGGLDSGMILQEVAKQLYDRVTAYVAAMPGHPSPDLKAARRLCGELSVDLVEVAVPEPDLLDIRYAIEAIEIPMKTQVEIAWPCLHLARRISEDGFKVVLSGEGADELFGGYGNQVIQGKDDRTWRDARLASMEKMARGNCVRTNKVFMRHGVEPRLPFLDHELVAAVLPLGLKGCPAHKKLLKDAAEGVLPSYIIDRPKVTFQEGAGVSAVTEELLRGQQIRTYNQLAKELFGGITRG